MDSGFIAPVAPDTPFRPLADALWAWASAAAQAIAGNGGHNQICDDTFVQSEPDVFTWRCRDRSVYDPNAVVRALSLTQIVDVGHALQSDPVLRPFVGKYVGVGSDLVWIHPQHLAQAALPSDESSASPRDLAFADPVKIEKLMRNLDVLVRSENLESILVTCERKIHIKLPCGRAQRSQGFAFA